MFFFFFFYLYFVVVVVVVVVTNKTFTLQNVRTKVMNKHGSTIVSLGQNVEMNSVTTPDSYIHVHEKIVHYQISRNFNSFTAKLFS